MNNSTPLASGLKLLKTLDIICGNFAHGVTAKDLKESTGEAGSRISIHLATLIAAGQVEIIQETGRYRPSVAYAQKAVSFLNSLETTIHQSEEIRQRINTEI